MARKLETEEIERLSTEQFKECNKIGLVVVLDNVRSLHNVGSVFRTADAYRIEEVILCGITAQPPHPDIHKSALGAEFSVSWRYYAETSEAIAELRNRGFKIASIEQADGSIMLNQFDIKKDERYAIVLGNEVKGVQQKVIDNSDFCIELPQYGTKHSLNVSVTSGIVIWEFAKNMITI